MDRELFLCSIEREKGYGIIPSPLRGEGQGEGKFQG